MDGFSMLNFFGQEQCTIDGNGRIKLTSRFGEDFERAGQQVVLYCLPEGGLGVYPTPVWAKMNPVQANAEELAGKSMLFRREMRMRMAYTQPAEISNQGRLTIPTLFRQHLDIDAGTEVVLVGNGFGMEIWNLQRWLKETERLGEHALAKGEAELTADMQKFQAINPEDK
jgi:DNA-binding transcriptional regulator/RsmH inhibitor MraZ